MSSLIHLIYSSAERVSFSGGDLLELLRRARLNNESLDVTGMLLYTDGSFFQILEGAPEAVDALFEKISSDPRHGQVVTIIREPIAARSFGEWTMGFADVSTSDLDEMVGVNDFFSAASCFGNLDRGRAKKLLAAFKEGRWRSRVSGARPQAAVSPHPHFAVAAEYVSPKVGFAFQPIIDAADRSVVGFEAIVCGANAEPASTVLSSTPVSSRSRFDADCRVIAIETAARLGITSNLHINFLAVNVDDAEAAIRATLDAAELNGIAPTRIVLEVDQDTLMGDKQRFGTVISQYRLAGVQFSIDNFGEGTAGLDLLEPYRPEIISLNPNLVRGVHTNGSRQAIVRGVAQTCADLGIDIIAKHVETIEEYEWLRGEGIEMFQGNLFASPGVDSLPSPVFPDVLVD